MKILFYDLYADKFGHNYFYDLNIMETLNESYECGYCAEIADSNVINELNGKKIHVHNLASSNVHPVSSSKNNKNAFKKIALYIQQNFSRFSNIIIRMKNVMNYFRMKKRKTSFLNNVMNIYKTNNYDHLHIFDYYYYGYETNIFVRNKDIKMTITLHWIPSTKSQKKQLKRLAASPNVAKIVVHGDFLYNKVIDMIDKEDIDKIVNIHYPLSSHKKIDVLEAQTKLNIDASIYKKPYILSYGALRYDKGVDILLDALNGIDKNYTVIIAGSENSFSRKYVLEKIEEYNLKDKVFLDLNFISDEATECYFTIADIVVVPYRKLFPGQSGPLTEGINYNSIILSSNVGQIGYTVKHYKVGDTFEAENVGDLREKLIYLIDNYEKIQNDIYLNQQEYKNIAGIESFKNNYLNMFSCLD